ncbi:MAG: acetyl-CoA carboxylase biotin carboxylase subunit [Pseudomonadota bacterium]
MSRFETLLIANRGEIACRIIDTARREGYRTVAVYSEADVGARHTQAADVAVCIGPAAVADSYLNAEQILRAAARTGADAIHPGYGFLSENAEFARACAAAGLVFIGPAPDAIEAMGNKAASKRRMLAAGVPCIPGYQAEEQSDAALLTAAAEIGFPLMVKAAAGGGGRGMRLVHSEAELAPALTSARSEAETAFGSDELILEKAVLRPRHVEVQVFGDSHGNLIYLGERDCSVQRRHQKVIEEAPCPVMTPALREEMGLAAVEAARSIAYEGAGTVEFLLDDDGHFYFLEMNTRLQVEHPVTEMITGLDLVALQLSVAQGEALPIAQSDVALDGHAIEVRLYAEDPTNDFLPASGTASRWRPPSGAGIRVDHGLLEGQEVSPFYDPMVAKIIAWGSDRAMACRRLRRALENTVLFGFENNRAFLHAALAEQTFQRGDATTAFIEETFTEGFVSAAPLLEHVALAAALQCHQAAQQMFLQRLDHSAGLQGWTGSRRFARQLRYTIGDEALNLAVTSQSDASYQVALAESEFAVEVAADDTRGGYVVEVDGARYGVVAHQISADSISVQMQGNATVFVDELAASTADASNEGSGTVTAPMHGNVLEISVEEGDHVAEGDALAVMEAMKMEHRLTASVAGTVVQINARVGDQLTAGAVILQIDRAE